MMLVIMSRFIFPLLRPLLRYMDPTMRSSAEAGVDVIDLATGNVHPHQRGYFTLLKQDASAPESLDETKQQNMWVKTLQWTKTTHRNTALKEAL